MVQVFSESIRQGWQVFAGPDRIGTVSYVKGDHVGRMSRSSWNFGEDLRDR